MVSRCIFLLPPGNSLPAKNVLCTNWKLNYSPYLNFSRNLLPYYPVTPYLKLCGKLPWKCILPKLKFQLFEPKNSPFYSTFCQFSVQFRANSVHSYIEILLSPILSPFLVHNFNSFFTGCPKRCGFLANHPVKLSFLEQKAKFIKIVGYHVSFLRWKVCRGVVTSSAIGKFCKQFSSPFIH